MKLKDFVNVHKNKKNKQIKLDIKKRTLKKYNLNVDDILNTKLNKKMKKFKRGN